MALTFITNALSFCWFHWEVDVSFALAIFETPLLFDNLSLAGLIDGSGSLLDLVREKEACLSEPNSTRNPNQIFGMAELWLVRAAVFVIFLVG